MSRTKKKQQGYKWFRRQRQRRREAKRRLFFEPMEARVLMTADPGGHSLAAAADIGTLNATPQIAVPNVSAHLAQSAPQRAPDGAGNSMSTARDLGTLRASMTFSDFVGQADPADFYRFRLESQSNLRLRMDGLSADADARAGRALKEIAVWPSSLRKILAVFGQHR